MPIFEQIRRSKASDVRLGTHGNADRRPADTQESLERSAGDLEIDSGSIAFKPLATMSGSAVVVRGPDKQKIVAYTNLFRQGGVTVLVGTTSLLGEGWFCVGQHTSLGLMVVLSNQMRGRHPNRRGQPHQDRQHLALDSAR